MKRPTVEEIAFYMEEKGMSKGNNPAGIPIIIDQQDEAFHDYFESNGWMVGKHKMKSWQAAVRTWLRNAKKWSKNGTRQQSNQTHSQRQHEQAQQTLREMEAGNSSVGTTIIRPLQ